MGKDAANTPFNFFQYFDSFNKAEIDNFISSSLKQNPTYHFLAFVAENNVETIPQLQELFAGYDADLIGAVFPELIVDANFIQQGIIVFAIKKSAHILVDEIPHDNISVKSKANDFSSKLESHLNSDSTYGLFMIFDAMLPNIATILDETFLIFGDEVNYMGVNAGSETFQPIPCLFDKDKIVGNAMLAILMNSDKPAELEHGYKVPDETIVATSTDSNCISSIDWKPAFETYREKIMQYYQVEINNENFYELAVHFPFGIIRADDEILVRIPVMLDDNEYLYCVGEIPENSILTLLESPTEGSTDTINNLSAKQSANTQNLIFYCAGRKMHLKEGAEQELNGFYNQIESGNYAGALTLGEIGSVNRGSYPLFHNATLVTISVN